MKLSHARGAIQDGQVMVERSDRMWPTGEGNGKPLQYSCLENPMNSIKRQNDRILKEDIVQETGIKTIPMEKKCKKAKWLSEEALQISVKRREVKHKGEKEKYKHLNADFQIIARRDKKVFLSD